MEHCRSRSDGPKRLRFVPTASSSGGSTEEWENAMELHEPTWTTIARVLGARRYPELARLIPARSGLAHDCEVCKGSGRLPVADIICQCGGIGWVEYVAGKS
jgi:hypothetical protein